MFLHSTPARMEDYNMIEDPQHILSDFEQQGKRSFNIDQTYSYLKNNEIQYIISSQCIQTHFCNLVLK